MKRCIFVENLSCMQNQFSCKSKMFFSPHLVLYLCRYIKPTVLRNWMHFICIQVKYGLLDSRIAWKHAIKNVYSALIRIRCLKFDLNWYWFEPKGGSESWCVFFAWLPLSPSYLYLKGGSVALVDVDGLVGLCDHNLQAGVPLHILHHPLLTLHTRNFIAILIPFSAKVYQWEIVFTYR